MVNANSGSAHPVDINDRQESTECPGQWTVWQTTNSPTTETSFILMNKSRETQERETDKFHDLLLSLGFEPPNHGVVATI